VVVRVVDRGAIEVEFGDVDFFAVPVLSCCAVRRVEQFVRVWSSRWWGRYRSAFCGC